MQNNELKLFYTNIEQEISPQTYEKLLNVVSSEKRIQIEKYRFEADRKRTLFAELLLRYVCSEYFKIGQNDFVLTKNEFGKPYLAGKNVPFFNLSHSGKYVLCGISFKECGVDIEKIKDCRNGIAKRAFSKNEFAELENAPDSEKAKIFYSYWTIKESYVKYLGKGLSVSLNSFSFVKVKDRFILEKSENTEKVNAFRICIDDSYMIGAVCADEINSISCEKVEIDEIIKKFD